MKTSIFKCILVISIILTNITSAYSQDDIPDSLLIDGPGPDVKFLSIYPYHIITDVPEFPEGIIALRKWFNLHTNYSQSMADSGYYGVVYFKVDIDTNGYISKPRVFANPQKRPPLPLIKETSRLLQLLPKFKPGKNHNKVVPVEYIFEFYYAPAPSGFKYPSPSKIIILPHKK